MQLNEIAIFVKLISGALGTFFAILVWSKTRNASWIFIVLGILFHYINIVFETLELFGIITEKIYNIGNLPILKIILNNLPMSFFIIGLIIFVIRKKI